MSDTAARAREQRIAEIRERESKATPGDWMPDIFGLKVYAGEPESMLSIHGPLFLGVMNGSGPSREQCENNVLFAAHARADIPFLLEQLAAQSAPIEEVAREIVALFSRPITASLHHVEKCIAVESILRQQGYGAHRPFTLEKVQCGLWNTLGNVGFNLQHKHVAKVNKAAKQLFDYLVSPVQPPESATPLHGICPNCGADRSGPSAEAHAANCPESATKEGEK